MATVYLQGKECHTNGELPETGHLTPDFSLTASDLEMKSLANYSGKKKLLYTVPSLDTMVCAKTTKSLNDLASEYTDIQFIVISADLPFAQQRFCKQNKLKNIITLSMMRDKQFALDYGILLTDGALEGLSTRAVFFVDEENKLIFTELTNDIIDNPDFKKVLNG